MSTTRDPATDQAAPVPAPAGVVGAHDRVLQLLPANPEDGAR